MFKTETIRRVLTLIVCVLFSLAAVSQSTTPPGTVIPNQAQAAFTTGSTPGSALSNTVIAQAQSVENVTLTASQSQLVKLASVVTLTHTLTNTGNASSDYRISYQNNPSDSSAAVALVSVKIYQDLNGNGIVDATDPELTSASTVHLNAGASAGLLVVMTVPTFAQTGATSTVVLTATSTVQNISASNTDTLTISGVIATLQKTASAATANPNDSLTFTLTASNTGNVTADPIAISVDGASKNLAVIRDTIPANASFTKIVNAGTAQVLYHLAGDVNLNNYVSAAPADLSTVDAIAFALANLPASANAAMSFNVTVHGNASGTITNVANFSYKDGGTALQVSSPTVTVSLPNPAPAVRFVDSNYTNTMTVGAMGSPVYLVGVASACNLNPLVAERQTIRIVTALSHDDETYSATETGPNTGIYNLGPIATQNATTNPVVIGDSILQVLENDRLTATLQCGAKAVAVSFFIDPAGIVFDSKTNAPIANAKVTLIDVDGTANGGHAGQAATVFALDGVTSAPSTITTAADGKYQFPQVGASTYRLQVVAPNGYKVPSTVPAAALPAGHNIDPSGSYLGNFSVNASTGTVMIDVPADTASLNGFFIEKTASKSVAQIGDFVDYSVTIKNNTGAQLTGVSVNDRFPKGFGLVKGTARLNGAVLADPTLNNLTAIFTIGTIDPNQSATLTYRLNIGSSTGNGKFANVAQAHSAQATSNQSSAVVEVQGGVFDERGYIVGNVTTTCPGTDGSKNFGVPGVKVFMEDGTYAITDAQGRYSFYGVRAQTHVLKLDAYSLPRGTQLLATSNRSMSDGGTQFVDLKFGELRRADFHCACSDRVKALVEQKTAAKTTNELSTLTNANFSADVQPTASSSSKNTTAAGTLAGGTDGVMRVATGTQSDITGYPLYTPDTKSSKSSANQESELRKDMDDTIGFANLKSGDVLADSMANIVVKGPSGSIFTLKVNGIEIPKSKIGDRSNIGQRIDIWTYIAIDLRPGHNVLEVSTTDPFGNIRKSTANIVVNSEVAKVVITAPKGALQADGVSLVPVKIDLFDKDGAPFKSEAQVTLDASAGAWLAKDFDEKTPGVQTFVSGAHVDLRLLSPVDAGDVKLRVSANGITSEATVSFVPALRPMTAAGVVEYALNFSHAGKNSIIPADGSEGFEETLRLFSTTSSSFSAGARSAMYLKGKVLGSNLLTMSYDSNKVSGSTMFRDIQPDQFYPVYGDSSTRGFDAQTTSKLYLRIDNGKSYLLYGDFQTADSGIQRMVTNYSRSLTGLKHHYENGKVSATSFASYDTFKQVVQEFAANGTSGPFTFSYTNGIQNSEKVEILVRDRNQQAMVLSQNTMSRFSDYEFEPFTGRLLFKSPIPTLDENMNPIYIRVTYEVEQGGSRFWAGGIDSQYKLNERVSLGLIAIADANPQESYQLYGLNSTLHPTKTGIISAELGNSHDQLTGSGIGYRVEYKEEMKRFNSDLYLGRTTATFVNQSGTLSKGRGEDGGRFKFKIDSASALDGEFLRSEDVTTGGTQVGARFGFERKLSKRFKLRIDLRHAQQSVLPSQQNVLSTNSTLISSGSPVGMPGTTTLSGIGPEVTPNNITTVGAKITADLPELHKSTVSAEFQQDVTDPDKHSFSIGASTALGAHGKLYARHEFLSSLGNLYSLNGGQSLMATVIGVDTDYWKHAHVFSEFRQHDELTNRDSEAAIGLRNLWQVKKDLGISAGFEHIRTFSGQDNSSIAVTGGVEFKAGSNTRGSARAEWRGGSNNKSFLTTFSLGRQFGTRWTLLTRDVFLHQVNSGQTSSGTDQFRIQTGAAYRGSEESKWDALALFEFRNESATGNPTALAGRLAVFSTNVNYQPSRGLTFSGRYATKFLTDQSNGLNTSALNQMFSYHVTKDVSRRVDVGFVGNLLTNSNLSTRQQGLGAEIGFQLKQNLWISSGYNFLGFKENDLPGGTDARQGAFVRLRFKFDENILKGNGRRQLKSQDTQEQEKQ
jgi:uncharacterized repeat protein (TIGR01451 family)